MKTVEKIKTEAEKIKALRLCLNKPIAILIGGIYGVGKTSLSYNLSYHLQIKQRVSAGVITKTIQYLHPKNRILRSLDLIYQNSGLFGEYQKHAQEICSVISYILKIARADGLDYLIDGVQLIPKYIDLDQNTFFIFLKAPGIDVYKSLLNNSETHPKRYKNIDIKQCQKLIELEEFLLSNLKEAENIKIFNHVSGEKELTLEVLKKIFNWLRNID